MSEQNIISILNGFVDVALRNRKYAPNTAYGYKAALKVFDDELSLEEHESFELFKERFDQIFSSIVNKKQKDFSISSLQVYKRRVLYVLRDYEKYGVDPSKMANWIPNRNKPHISKSGPGSQSVISGKPNENSGLAMGSDYSKHEYSLRPSKKILIYYPSDFTLEEAKSIQSFAEYLISMHGEDHS